MRKTRMIMGMPVIVEVCDESVNEEDLDDVFAYFISADERFSTYKKDSEIEKINRSEIPKNKYSAQMRQVLSLSQKTKDETNGYFDINLNGRIDPSGLVKGWAIANAAKLLNKKGFKNYYIEAGGDIQVRGKNMRGKLWTVGIRNPLNLSEIVKVVELKNYAVATSGNYERGRHIYNPIKKTHANEILSMTVVAKSIYDADRFATAAFAMGNVGINFVERSVGLEGYMIGKDGLATYTSGFGKFVTN